MFFEASKLLWAIVAPANLLVLALAVGALLLWTRWRRGGRLLVGAAALFAVFVSTVPAGHWLIATLEDRFPTPRDLPETVDGIVVLGGGAVAPKVSAARGRMVIGSAVDRVFGAADLAERYPQARVVFTAGSGSLRAPDDREADHVAPLFSRMGVDPRRLILENRARNTWENALYARELAAPARGETWILVTSAFHMPRAVGCFRSAGWTVIPYPVAYKTAGNDQTPALGFSPLGGLRLLSLGVHEWLGLVAYRLAGRTDALFPGPER